MSLSATKSNSGVTKFCQVRLEIGSTISRGQIVNSKLFASLTGVVIIFATHGLAVEVTEPAGAEHGYPGLCDINGKKLADGEFRQWMENERLHVVITYKFPDGQFFEENALFRHEPELMQEQWSWKELKDGKPQREFRADFLSGMASA